MATKTLNTRICQKVDSHANWIANDPVLKAGEIAIDVIPAETGVSRKEPITLMKVGDGTKKFSELEYIGAYAIDVYAWAKAATKPSYEAAEITGLPDFIKANQNADTNTKYQIVKISDYSYKLQFKELDGTWTDQDTFTIPSPESIIIASGATNGTISVKKDDGEAIDVAVTGLKSAAYQESSAFDAAGAAEAVLGKNSDSASTATVYGVQKAASAAQTAADNAKTAADGAKSAADAAQATADAAMPKAGGTFTGPVTLNGAPTSDLHAATKKYVDDKTAALSSATHFIGIKEALPASANSGDICIVGKKEYIYDGTNWQELGDETLYVQKEEGKGLSSNDFTDTLLTKLNGIEEGAQKNVQSDWNATSGDALIKNKPDALKNPTALSFGSKTYDGSEAVTLTAEDIGAITQHQDISGKQDKLTFDGVYNASSNKVATVSTVNSAINGLAAIAKTGNVNDLVQTEGDVLIFYCGTSNTVM